MKPHFWNLLKRYHPRLQQHCKRQIINLSDLNHMGRHCMPFSEYWFNQWLLVKSECDIITDTNWGFAGYDTAVKSNCLEIFSRMEESDVKLKSTEIARTCISSTGAIVDAGDPVHCWTVGAGETWSSLGASCPTPTILSLTNFLLF